MGSSRDHARRTDASTVCLELAHACAKIEQVRMRFVAGEAPKLDSVGSRIHRRRACAMRTLESPKQAIVGNWVVDLAVRYVPPAAAALCLAFLTAEHRSDAALMMGRNLGVGLVACSVAMALVGRRQWRFPTVLMLYVVAALSWRLAALSLGLHSIASVAMALALTFGVHQVLRRLPGLTVEETDATTAIFGTYIVCFLDGQDAVGMLLTPPPDPLPARAERGCSAYTSIRTAVTLYSGAPTTVSRSLLVTRFVNTLGSWNVVKSSPGRILPLTFTGRRVRP